MKDATSTSERITIRTEWCKACGICVAVCPKHGLELVDGIPTLVKPEECTGCALCEQHCPDWAICVTSGKRRSPGDV